MVKVDAKITNQIRGQILTTIAASQNRDDLWKLADEIATFLSAYLQTSDHFVGVGKMVAPGTDVVIEPDAKTVAWLKSIDDELDAPEPEQPSEHITNEIVTPSHSLNEIESATIEPIWTEWAIDWNDYDLSQYSNPCVSKYADGTIRHVETELWLISKDTGELKTCDAHFKSSDELRAYCDPLVQIYNSKPHTEYIDENLDNAAQALRKACRENHERREKTRIDQFVALWEQYPGNNKYIADLMGITIQSVYTYKNKAKNKGLIK